MLEATIGGAECGQASERMGDACLAAGGGDRGLPVVSILVRPARNLRRLRVATELHRFHRGAVEARSIDICHVDGGCGQAAPEANADSCKRA